jgi:RNA-directed DNA polymerase
MSKTKPFSISKKVVGDAYKRVKANKGAAGVDRVSLEDFEENLEKNLYKIWNRMSSGSYFPPPVRAVDIEKDQSRKRRLGIPTVSDRIAQMVAKIYLEPGIEPHFHPDSYGYRTEKSALQAVGKARERCWEYNWVLDLDIKGFFDNLDHDIMMTLLKKHTEEKWIIMYIERWLKAPSQLEDGTLIERTKGTPQGGVISPLLANLYLHYAFDEWMREKCPTVPFERYADDVVVHCRTEKQALWVRKEIEKRLAEFKLELHPEKTKIVYCKDSKRKGGYENTKFEFLGFEFRPHVSMNHWKQLFVGFSPAISPKALRKIYQTIRDWRIHRSTGSTIDGIAKQINPVVRGWINYYGSYYKSALNRVLNHLDWKLVKWAIRKYKRLKGSERRAWKWLNRIKRKEPNLYVHWSMVKE